MQPDTKYKPENTAESPVTIQDSAQASTDSTRQVSDFLTTRDINTVEPEQPKTVEPSEDSNRIESSTVESESKEDLNLLEELKEDRDKLRGVTQERDTNKTKRALKVLGITIGTLTLLFIIGFTIFKSLNKPEEILQHQNFALPADLSSKSADEQAAINVIALARKGDFEQITSKWLGSKDLSGSKEDFKNLITSYEASADGKKVELVEKKVGKTDFGVQGAKEVNAVSLIYKSSYFEHPNSLYTKLNLYEPTATPGTWKLYLFEFNAQDGDKPPKADLSV